MTREKYLLKLEEEQAFFYFHLKPMDEKQHNKWINHIFYLIKQSANEVFDYHEEQLKAKDEEIEVLHSHLKTIDEDYSALASDFESAVMEIDRLKDTK